MPYHDPLRPGPDAVKQTVILIGQHKSASEIFNSLDGVYRLD